MMRAFRLFREQRTLQSFPRGGHAGLRSRTFNTLSRVSPRQQNASFSSSSPIFQLLYKQPRSFLFRKPFAKRLNSTKPNFNPTPNLGSPEPALSLSQRLRKLSREYGWSALGVYLLLSAVDFPFCFIAVRLLGTDRIGHLEHIVVERFWKIIELAVPNIRGQETPSVEVEGVGKPVEAYAQVDSQSTEVGVAGYDHGVEEAEKRNKAEASIWTQLALAYAIHKSFIFIRVPLTAALTPKVVRVLRGWGWNIGKRRPKGPKSAKD